MSEHAGRVTTAQLLSSGEFAARSLGYVWDPVLLDFVVATNAGGGGGGGGAATIADGADVAQGRTTDQDPGAFSPTGTVVGYLQGIRAAFAQTLGVSVINGTVQTQALDGLVVIHPMPKDGGSVHLVDALGNVIDPATKQQLPAALVGGRLDVNVGASAAVPVTDSGGSLTVDAPVATPVFTRLSDGVAALIGQKLLAASLPVAIASDQGPLVLTGSKSNNAAAPGATNLGALMALANEAIPAIYTEGNLVFLSTDLRGLARVIDTAEDCLGESEWEGITGTYTGLATLTPLCSLRWGDATRFCKILRVEILVFTSTAATVAGITERQLVVARSFTVSDSGGVAANLTGNNQKLRTSDAASLVTDLRIGNPLTPGTRVLDAAPIASAAGWSGLLSTGVVIGASGSSAVGAARSTEGGGQFVALFDAEKPGTRKLVLAQNEGIVIRVGAAQPTSAVQQTMVKIKYRVTNKPN